eukprot:3383837-Pyramimonas_sp.AAC.1
MLASLWEHPRKRRRSVERGGWRQRLEVDVGAEEDPPTRRISLFAAGSLQDWADGVTSASKLAHHMQNLVKDMEHEGQEPHPT